VQIRELTMVAATLIACAPPTSSPIASPAINSPAASAATASASTANTPAQVTFGLAFLTDNLYRDNDRDWPVSDSGNASTSFDEGHGYVVRIAGPSRSLYPSPSFKGVAPEKLSDYAVDVQVLEGLRLGTTDAVGVFCRYAAPSTQQYSFLVRVGTDGTETYEIWRDDRAPGGQPRKLASGSQRPSAPAVTRTLRAVCVGGRTGPAELIFYVTGRQVLRATDDRTPLTTGLAGLVLVTGPGSSEATAKFAFFSATPVTLAQ
jgi:hypothetical protein